MASLDRLDFANQIVEEYIKVLENRDVFVSTVNQDYLTNRSVIVVLKIICSNYFDFEALPKIKNSNIIGICEISKSRRDHDFYDDHAYAIWTNARSYEIHLEIILPPLPDKFGGARNFFI